MCIAYAGGLSDEHFYGREMNWSSGDARDIVSRARLVDPDDGLAAIEAAREATLQIVRRNAAAVRELGWCLATSANDELNADKVNRILAQFEPLGAAPEWPMPKRFARRAVPQGEYMLDGVPFRWRQDGYVRAR
jgi:hypothetical protein